jgi:hypothetical protein
MTNTNPFEASLSQPISARQPSPRRRNLTVSAVGLLIVIALVVGYLVLRNHGSPNPATVSTTTQWNSTSDNWSGYAQSTAQTGQKYTKVALEWTVPSVTTMSSFGCVANWAGIGGMTGKDLIQLGTQSCSNSSGTGYDIWYETLPAAETPITTLHIQPGDRVLATLQLMNGSTNTNAQAEAATFASVVGDVRRFDPTFPTSHILQRLRQLLQEGNAHLQLVPWFSRVSTELRRLFSTPAVSTSQQWQFAFKVTAPSGAVQNWTKTVSYQSSLSSVEWITEAPTFSSGVSVLPAYGTSHYQTSSANGGTPTLSASDQIVLSDPHGQASVPSAPSGSDAFNTCFFPTLSVTSCPAP